MPRQVLTAPFRLVFRYTVGAFTHKLQQYLNVAVSGDATGFDTVARTGFANAGLSLVDGRVFGALAPFFNPANTTFDSITLEQLISGTWVFVLAIPSVVAPTGGGVVNTSMGYGLSGKDTGNRNMNVYFYEGNFGVTQKQTAYGGIGANNQVIVARWFKSIGAPGNSDPYAWRTSQDGAFASRWLAMVIDSNQKLRRLRRIA